MADKKYISFDLTNEEDRKVVQALGLISRFMDISPKELVKRSVSEITKSKEYKNALRELIKEAEAQIQE